MHRNWKRSYRTCLGTVGCVTSKNQSKRHTDTSPCIHPFSSRVQFFQAVISIEAHAYTVLMQYTNTVMIIDHRVLVAAVDKSTTNPELHFFNNCFGDGFDERESLKN